MNLRSLRGVALVSLASACGGPSPQADPAPEGEGSVEASAPQLNQFVVLRAFTGHEPGDTVRVDLSGISGDDRVAVYGETGPSGGAPLEALGTTGPGPMVVAADRAHVRRCRSKGCSVVGYVVRGQVVQVHDYFDRWYRFTGSNGTRGYVWAEYLRLPVLMRRELLEEYRERAATYYERELAPLDLEGYGGLFAGHQVRLKDGLLDFAFYARTRDPAALPVLCNAMRGIATFVGSLVDDAPAEIFPAYSAGIYFDTPDAPGQADVTLAGLSSGGRVYCQTP